MKTLVTGASGFVGRALSDRMLKDGVPVRGSVRCTDQARIGCQDFNVGDISSETDWTSALCEVVRVVHLAARVHVMNDKSVDPLSEFRRVNVEGTANLARQAAAVGVRRFIFVSSIKVNGEFTLPGLPFCAEDHPSPQDPYAVSKWEAEQKLHAIASATGMEVVIIRPPLVYGPGVRANFESMVRWLARGVPLPLASVHKNRRSLVSVDNLVDLILLCLKHPAAANQTFLVSDGDDLSTAQLLNHVAEAMGRPAQLFPMPPALLRHLLSLANRPHIYQRLCGSLQLDIGKARDLLGWTPPVSVCEGLRATVRGIP